MILTHQQPIDTTTGRTVSTYRVIGAGDTFMPGYANVIRAELQNEPGASQERNLRMWDLVVVTPNRYHWRRLDWPEGAVTRALIRCEGKRALERSDPPA
jgi:hypothetical protein